MSPRTTGLDIALLPILMAVALLTTGCTDQAGDAESSTDDPSAASTPATAGTGESTDAPPESTDAPPTASTPTTDAHDATSIPPSPADHEADLDDDQAVVIGLSPDVGGLAVVDVTTGDVIRQLPGQLGQGASSLDHVPGQGTVLYSRAVTGARSEVVEVALDGSTEPRVVDVGYAVDATDDGRRLAIARRLAGEDRTQLEVREGDQTLGTWSTESTDELPADPDNLAWSPDGAHLAFDVRFEDGTSVFLLDVNDVPADGDLLEVARPIEPDEGQAALYSHPFWLPDGDLGVVQACCGLADLDTWTFVRVDVETGEVVEELLEIDRAVGAIDVHGEEARLVFVTTHDATGSDLAPAPDQLSWWDGGAPTEVLPGVADAAW